MNIKLTQPPTPPLTQMEGCLLTAALENNRRIHMVLFLTESLAVGKPITTEQAEEKALRATQAFARTAFPHLGIEVSGD